MLISLFKGEKNSESLGKENLKKINLVQSIHKRILISSWKSLSFQLKKRGQGNINENIYNIQL